MPVTLWVILCILAALGGLVLGYGSARFLDRSQFTHTRAVVAEITENAKKDAENILKEAELKAKDELFNKREQFNQETEQIKGELREQDRRLEKREDSLDQKHQILLKKERVLDHSERKLKERRAEVEKRNQQLERVLTEETQKLHDISMLTREQAENLAARASGQGTGRRDGQPHPEARGAACRPSVSRRHGRSWRRLFSAMPPSTQPIPRSAPWTFPATT